MGSSGRFDSWRVVHAEAISWFYAEDTPAGAQSTARLERVDGEPAEPAALPVKPSRMRGLRPLITGEQGRNHYARKALSLMDVNRLSKAELIERSGYRMLQDFC